MEDLTVHHSVWMTVHSKVHCSGWAKARPKVCLKVHKMGDQMDHYWEETSGSRSAPTKVIH